MLSYRLWKGCVYAWTQWKLKNPESMNHSEMEMSTTRLPHHTFLCHGQVIIWEHLTGRHPQCLATVQCSPRKGPHTSSSFDVPLVKGLP